MPDVVHTLLPAALAIIMFAVGITLVPADFTRLLAQPKAVIAGLARARSWCCRRRPGRSRSPGACRRKWRPGS